MLGYLLGDDRSKLSIAKVGVTLVFLIVIVVVLIVVANIATRRHFLK